MGTFFVLLLVFLVIIFIAKSSKKKTSVPKTENLIDVKVTMGNSGNSTASYERGPKFRPVKQDTNGDWRLNPAASFKLTLQNANEEIAKEVRSILDDEKHGGYRKIEKVTALFAQYNLKVKEIESYKKQYGKQYFELIEEQKANSEEWKVSGEKDREDIMVDFREVAIKSLYERADCDLQVLFEFEPSDITLDDSLIEEYGFENLQVYLQYAENIEKVRVIQNDSYYRPIFDKLVELGLAVKGHELEKEEILMTLTLKELNAIAKHPEKEYKRKKQAVEYILELDNVDSLIGKHVSLRELFKLKPLPEKYSSIDMDILSKTWKYHSEEAKLLVDTFNSTYDTWLTLKEKEYVDYYKVDVYDNEDACQCALERSNKKYPKSSPPKVPCHIGCNCSLSEEYE